MNAVTSSIDFQALAQLALSQQADLLPRWFSAGRRSGREFTVGDIHNSPGDSLSINTVNGKWADFATGIRGTDLISLYAAIHGLAQVEAARDLAEQLGLPLDQRSSVTTPLPKAPAPTPVAEWTPMLPVPHDALDPVFIHPAHGKAVHVATYRDRGGNLLGYVLRCQPQKDGKKQVPSLVFCRHQNGRREWRWQSLPKPRSLYGAELLDEMQDVPVLVVEGEPKCDAARRMLGDRMLVVAWPGGTNATHHADWSLLEGRTVLVWPDADDAGHKAAEKIVHALHELGTSARVVLPPSDAPDAWDLADAEKEGWTGDQVLDHCGLTKAMSAPVGRRSAGLPPIQVLGYDLDLISTLGEEALVASKIPVFRRDKELVRPVSHMVPASGGRMTIAAGLEKIGQPAMMDLLSQAVAWDRYDARKKKRIECDPPQKVAEVILSRAGSSRLPPVSGVITTPTLRPDGSVLMEPGYDAATRLYHIPDPALRMPHMPEKPTQVDANRAMDLLSSLLAEFPFVDEVSRSVALSAIITGVVRGALSVAPLHAFRASTAGSGKSYLADIVSMIATGRPCPVMAVSERDEETEKRLVGMLLSGFPIISLDNVNGELGGDLLCQAIERPLVRARPLGGSEIIEIESRATFLATGNGMRVRGDMTRRTLLCSLDAGAERPELREFSGNPAADVAGARGKYVAAALTVVRAYLGAGKPGTLAPLASFDEWNSWVRGTLIWLGCADPVASMEDARTDDPELSELRELLGCWASAVGVDEDITVRELDVLSSQKVMRKVEHTGRNREVESFFVATDDFEHPDLRDALVKIAGERGTVNSRRLGKWLLAREGRIADGLKIIRNGQDRNKVAIWKITQVKKGN